MSNKIIPDPNFTIIVPGGCNAKCDFCFWEQEKTIKDYILKLGFVLDNLPENFQSLSLSGGEPTLSKHFPQVLETIDRKRWKKVVLTTNGTNLDAIDTDLLAKNVDHINISRHAISETKNREIFNTDTVPTKAAVEKLCAKMNKIGIDVNLNCVLVGQFEKKKDIKDYISFAKDVGATTVCFRNEQNEDKDEDDTAIDVTREEKWFSGIKTVGVGGCPVCRSKSQYIDGVLVTWKAAYNEPSEALKDTIYEGVFQPTGKLTSDWEGKNNIAMSLDDLIVYDHINDKILGPLEEVNTDNRYVRDLENQNEELLDRLEEAISHLDEIEAEKFRARELVARAMTSGGGCGGSRPSGCGG